MICAPLIYVASGWLKRKKVVKVHHVQGEHNGKQNDDEPGEDKHRAVPRYRFKPG